MKSCLSRAWLFLSGRYSILAFSPVERFTEKANPVKMAFLAGMFFFVLFSANATTWYVDNTASGNGSGTSWGNAFTSFSSLVSHYGSINPGDVVQISGGPSGSSQTYVMNTGQTGNNWYPKGGANGNPIIYEIGQDPQHNGTAIFSPGSGGSEWIQASSSWSPNAANSIISGDAGDGKMHFALTNYNEAVGFFGPVSNVTVQYVNFGSIGVGPTTDNGATLVGPGININHTYGFISGPAADHYSAMWFAGNGYDQNVFYNNTVYVPRISSGVNSSGGDGADCLQWNANAWSAYSNVLVAYVCSPAYSGGQHQDGMQPEGGQYISIHDNVIVNMSNYGLYPEGLYGGFQHMKIYNNIILQNNSQGIAVGLGGSDPNNPTDKDVIVANNLVDGGSLAVAMWNAQNLGPTAAIAGAGLVTANNIGVGSGFQLDLNVSRVSNLTITPTQAAQYFKYYTAGAGVDGSANLIDNYRPVSTATALIGTGTNMSGYFRTDMDGKLRPATGAWDIGPYAYSTSTNIYYTISASAGTGGSISPAGPISVVAGGNQTFTIAASGGYQITNVLVDGTNIGAVSTYTFTNVTTNHTVSASFASTGVNPPSAPGNLSASPVSPSEIDLSWSGSTAGTYAIAGYHIYVNGATAPSTSVTTTSYKSTGLLANTTNSFIVTAYDTAGNESSQSAVAAATWPVLSTKFSANQQVQILATANVRQQPTNEVAGAVIGTQPAGALATVVGGPIYAAINGVYYYWWNLSFSSSPSGWVAEDNVQAYSAPVNPIIQVSANSLPFGTLLVGTGATNNFTVSNTGGGTLSGTASVASPFRIVSGGTYSLTNSQSQTVTVSFNPSLAGTYNQNVTLTGGNGATVGLTAAATNAQVVVPTVSAISMNVTDVDLNLSGLQIYSGTTVQFSATATNFQTWQWNYSINGGSPIVYSSGTGPVTNVSFYFGTNTIGNSYLWSLVVSNGQAGALSSTNFAVEAMPPAGTIITNIVQGPTIAATSGTLKGLMTATTTISNVPTTYFYQPLPSIGNTSGGTATYNVTITNAGNYEIQALVYAPNINANSFLVNIDGQPQNPAMIWDIMPVTSGFEQRLVCWRGATGSENNDSIVPVVFNLSAGTHQIVFVGREPGTGMASFSLMQIVTTAQAPSQPAAPTGLRIISSAF